MFATVLVPEIDMPAGPFHDLNSGTFCDRKRAKGIPDFNCYYDAVRIVAVNNLEMVEETTAFNRYNLRIVPVSWRRPRKQKDGQNDHHNCGTSG